MVIRQTLYRIPAAAVALLSSVSRRLDDRMRELSAKALTAWDSDLDSTFTRLQSSLQEHTKRLRKMAAEKLAAPREKEKSGDRSEHPNKPVLTKCNESDILLDSPLRTRAGC